MCDDKAIDVFVSHFSDESNVADLVDRFLRSAFGDELRVFLSYKIPVGEHWFPQILESLGSACVVVVLLSRQSVGKRWINFESGFGAGAGAKLLPYTIGSLEPGDVGHPLSSLQVHRLNDRANVEGLLQRISQETGMSVIGLPDIATFCAELGAIEESLLSSSIYLNPFKTGNWINFELILEGDVPVRLVKLRVALPDDLRSHNGGPLPVAGHVRSATELLNGTQHFVVEQSAGDIPVPFGTPQTFERLLQDFTPDMSGQRIRPIGILLKENMEYVDWRKRLRCKVFVVNFDTPEQIFNLDQIENRER